MADEYKKPYLDSSVFIGGLRKEICHGIKRGVVFEYIWARAIEGQFKIYTSALTLAEVYKRRDSAHPLEAPILDEFLERVNSLSVEIIEIDRETGIKANELCRLHDKNNLLPNDALHLACALRAKCDRLLAWDTHLNSVVLPDIRIEEPAMAGRGLYEETEIATPEEIDAFELMIATEKADREAAERHLQREDYLIAKDQAADSIVKAVHEGKLSNPFQAKQIRGIFGSEFNKNFHSTIPYDYCSDGKYVRMGRKPRFNKIARGAYAALATLSANEKGAK